MKEEVISINLSETNLVEDTVAETIAEVSHIEETPLIEEIQVEMEVIPNVDIIPVVIHTHKSR